jgi:hypothetical protein
MSSSCPHAQVQPAGQLAAGVQAAQAATWAASVEYPYSYTLVVARNGVIDMFIQWYP